MEENTLEEIMSGHFWIGYILLIGCLLHVLTKPFGVFIRAFIWSSEGILGYSLSALSVIRFIAATFSWYNNTIYPSEFYGPTGPEASQAQTFFISLFSFRLFKSFVYFYSSYTIYR